MSSEAQLRLATTAELLVELETRFRISGERDLANRIERIEEDAGELSPALLAYRTVDH